MKIDKGYVRERFYNLYHKKWRGTQAQFAEAVKMLDPGNGITNDYVSKLLRGIYTPSGKNLQLFCQVLGVDYKTEFLPSSYEDKYRYSAEYQDKVSAWFEKAAAECGLKLSFIYGLRQLVDFDKEFPLTTNLIVAAADPEQFIPSRLKYRRAEPVKAQEASTGKRLHQVADGDNVYNLSGMDMKFLKEIQETVIDTVRSLFAQHRQELIDAENIASEKCDGYSFAEMFTSGHDPLSPEELQEIDKSGIYTVDELNRCKIPLPPEDLPLTSAYNDPGIVIGHKKK